MSITKFKTLFILLIIASSTLAEVTDGKDEMLEMAALLELLEQETELATQSKMNADYVPGMVTILQGEEMLSYGVSNVADALDQVAGFYVSVNNAGDPITIVRGVGVSLNGSNLKILVDGIAVNRPVDGSADWALRLPMAQIDRIEVIRGPGSSLHGEYAFSGVINIITRKSKQLALRAGSHDAVTGNLMIDHFFATGARASVNISSWDRNNSGMKTNPDNFAGSGVGHSPGEVYDHERGQVLLVDTSHYGYRIQLQYAHVERGGGYGRNAAMPVDLEPRNETITSLQLSKSWQLADELSLGAILSSLQTDLEKATFLPIPAGTAGPGGPGPGTGPIVAADRYRQDASEDSSERVRVNLHWTGLQNHQLFFELGYSRSKVDDSWITLQVLGSPRTYGAPDRARVLEDAERTLTSVTLQDQWALTDNLELTIGARHDNYDDWGNSTSPRIATVWRASDHHIFKFQYAEAFRPPTLADQNPGPNTFPGSLYTTLQEERLKSTELAYIHNGTGYSFRSTLFNTKVENLIEFTIRAGRPPTLRNRGELESTGLELEWMQRIDRDWEWNAKLSYVDTEDDNDADGTLIGSVEWLANLGVSWTSSPRIQHSLDLRYIGQQEGLDNPIRNATEEFDAYTTLDYVITLQRPANIANLIVRAGINNLADHSYDTVATPTQYPEGLPQGERTGWLQINYSF